MQLRPAAVAVLVLVGCGDDIGVSTPASSSESSAGEGSTGASSGATDGVSNSGAVVDDSSSTSSSSSSSSDAESGSESTGGEPSAVLRTLMVDDLDGDGQQWAYMVEWSGDEVSPPIPVHGPTPADVDVGVTAVSDELVAISTTTTTFGNRARTWTLVEIYGDAAGPSGPLVLEPAPLFSAFYVQFVPEDARAVFSACESEQVDCSLWSTSYDGAVVQAPERVSPLAPALSFPSLFELAPAADGVVARGVGDDGVSNLVWMPLAPADPDAAVTLTAHTETWQDASMLGFGADGETVHFLDSVSEDHEQLFVDDLDEGTLAVAVHPGLMPEQTVGSPRLAPDGGAFAYWVGSIEPPMPARGDVYLATLDGTAVGVPIDVAAAEATASADAIGWSPDSRWLVYRLHAGQPRRWIARVDGGEVERFMLPDSGTGEVAFDADAHFLYYVSAEARLQRVDVGGDTPGVPQLVSETPAAGGVRLTSDAAALAFVGNDPGGNWAAYLIETASLPAFTQRIDPAPEPGARLSPSAIFTADQRFVMTHEFIAGDVPPPARVHATRVAEPGVTVLLGASYGGDYDTLPTPER